jgi:hypothetical protein
MRVVIFAIVIVGLAHATFVAGAETTPEAEAVFSGPQVGEKLPPLPVRGVFDENAGKDLDFVDAAGGKPIVLVFVHQLDRPTIGMARALTEYTLSRTKDGLSTGIVWLDDDATEAENTLKRIRHALPRGVPIGISTDGREGPGSYGLNRNVALTILVGNEGKVTANFALVQPSIQVDLPKVFEPIVEIVGGKAPDVAEFAPREGMRRMAAPEPDPRLRRLIRPLIQLDATEDEVDKAAANVEEFLAENEAAQKDVGRISKTIVDSGKLQNYGTPRAQEYLRKWAKRYGGDAERDRARPRDDVSKQAPSESASR